MRTRILLPLAALVLILATGCSALQGGNKYSEADVQATIAALQTPTATPHLITEEELEARIEAALEERQTDEASQEAETNPEITTEEPNQVPPPAATATPLPPAEVAETSVEVSGWVHNPDLPTPNGYTGWVRMVGQQQSDGLSPREVEITARENELGLIFGDYADIPPIGPVGGQWNSDGVSSGCYLVVFMGPFVWDTQPGEGEYEPLSWFGRSAWDLHVTDGSASPLMWAAQKANDLAVSYPDTCGKSIDVWVYAGEAR